ncbi:hypothetical protein F511_39732 [Dorcoceras hygrometricum]|uniref:Uncharacterized protein n=1 Tax=Dorcoceras hygrometricum TaxID=472368 RepID=A0A2Z7CU04_9LAMI|nr:hypothetical protein F511_39732 [Dorcoceras hygrometricum]
MNQLSLFKKLSRCARYGISCDDISLDVITISSWLSADETKRERRSDVVWRFSRWINVDDVISDVIQSQESADSADAICVDNQSQDPVASYSGSRRKQKQHPVESLFESAVAIYTVASYFHPVAKIQTQEKKKQRSVATSRKLKHPVARFPVAVFEASAVAQSIQSTKISAEDESSRSDKSAAKQLTIYEELDVNC